MSISISYPENEIHDVRSDPESKDGQEIEPEILAYLNQDVEFDQDPLHDETEDPKPESQQENESDIDVELMELGRDPHTDSETEDGHEWLEDFSNFTDRLRPFTECSGPVHDLPEEDSEPLDYFKLFLSDTMIDMMVEQTNLCARLNSDPRWKPVTSDDICKYLSINIIFGLHQVPEPHLYWSTDPFWRVPAIADLMGRSRFEKIHEYFRLADPAQQPKKGRQPYGSDPLFKVRPLLDHVRKQCQALYKPTQKISVDEVMIGFTGHPDFNHHVKENPLSLQRIKVWCCTEISTGYVLNFQCHTGKNNQVSEHGQEYDVVMRLTRPYLDRNHVVYFDNFFSSPQLITDLIKMKTYPCRTICPNRKGWPYPKKKKPAKGSAQASQKDLVVASQWTDKIQVNVLSTDCDSEMTIVTGPEKLGLPEVHLPVPAIDYNSGIFGVDFSDQRRCYYRIGRQGQKWWRNLVWYLLQVALVNSFLLMRAAKPNAPRGSPAESHLSFRTAVVKSLAFSPSRKRNAKEAPTVCGQARAYSPTHHLSRMPGRKRRCFQCLQDRNKTASGRISETATGCILCNVHLHRGMCYAKFHHKLKN